MCCVIIYRFIKGMSHITLELSLQRTLATVAVTNALTMMNKITMISIACKFLLA